MNSRRGTWGILRHFRHGARRHPRLLTGPTALASWTHTDQALPPIQPPWGPHGSLTGAGCRQDRMALMLPQHRDGLPRELPCHPHRARCHHAGPSRARSNQPRARGASQKHRTSQFGLGATAGCALSQVTPSGARGQLKGHRPRHTATRTAPAPQATRTGHTALPAPHSRDTFRDKRCS